MKNGALRGSILISGVEADSYLAGPEELLVRQFRETVHKVLKERKVSGGFFAFRLQWAELSEDALDFK